MALCRTIFSASTEACVAYRFGWVNLSDRLLNLRIVDWTPRLRQSVKRHFAVRCRSIVGRG